MSRKYFSSTTGQHKPDSTGVVEARSSGGTEREQKPAGFTVLRPNVERKVNPADQETKLRV